MRQFIGWDCANRTLAWSHVTVDTHIYSKLAAMSDALVELIDSHVGEGAAAKIVTCNLSADQRELLVDSLEDPDFVDNVMFILGAIHYFTGQFLQYISAGVRDVLDGRLVRDTTGIERTEALWRFLKTHPDLGNPPRDCKPVIEQQPSKLSTMGGAKTNNQAAISSYQLALYYVEHRPVMINAKLKNNIALRDDLTFARFLAAQRSKDPARARYLARKAHSTENFLYLLSVFGLEDVIADVPRAVMDDLADSTMEILAYLRENKLFT